MKKLLLPFFAILIFAACKKDKNPGPGDHTPPPTTPPVLLKDIVEAHLPSPYYHFEYDASGKVSFVSFASEFTRYDVIYNGNKIIEMRNNILVNKDRLQYSYDNDGKVGLIKYADSNGVVFKTVQFFYDGPRLIRLDRARKVSAGFVFELTTLLSYFPDGNLKDITYHYLPFEGQPEVQYTLHYDQYDNKLNEGGFGLLHQEFFDHLVFLPGVQIQKNNPGKESLTGDGDNYTVTYTYTYNDRSAPLIKTGDLVFLTGSHAGQHIQVQTTYSYY